MTEVESQCSPDDVVVLVAEGVPATNLADVKRTFPRLKFARLGDASRSETAQAEVLLQIGMSSDAILDLLNCLPNLKWIHSASAGLDKFMVPAIVDKQVQVTRTAYARAGPIAEHVLAGTLALLKSIPDLIELKRLRKWQRTSPAVVAGMTVGFVGIGEVGRAIASRFKGFETKLIGIKRRPTPLNGFDEVLAPNRLVDVLGRADVVVLACPLTSHTRGLMDARRLSSMKAGSLLVNVARGGVVVERDLIAALREGRLGGAVLDVFEYEPLPAESPLWEMNNVIISSHSSSAGDGVWTDVMHEFAENLTRYLAGEPLLNRLRPELEY